MKKSVKKTKLSIQLLDKMLPVILAIVFISGILLHPFGEVLAIKILHKSSSLLLVVGVILHVIWHRRRKESSL